jgi:two-component system chemotaxis response regulator CheY
MLLKDYKILVVDDHLMMRQMVLITLNRLGFTSIDSAVDGSDALNKIKLAAQKNQAYDVVFLDWSMPEPSGYDVLLLCRKDPLLSDMAIIMLTSESEEENVNKALAVGANAYITKPFQPDVVLKKLEIVHAKRFPQ